MASDPVIGTVETPWVSASTRMTDGGEVFSTHTAPNPYTISPGPGPTVIGSPTTRFVAGSIRMRRPGPALSCVTHTRPPPAAIPPTFPPASIAAITQSVAGSIRYTTPLFAVTHTLPSPTAMLLKSSTPGVVILATTRLVAGSTRVTAPNPDTHTASSVAATSTAPWRRTCAAKTGWSGVATTSPRLPRSPNSKASGRPTPERTTTLRTPPRTRLRWRLARALASTPSILGTNDAPSGVRCRCERILSSVPIRILPVRGPERLTRADEVGTDGPLPRAQDAGDLVDLHPQPVVEDDDLPLAAGKHPYLLPQVDVRLRVPVDSAGGNWGATAQIAARDVQGRGHDPSSGPRFGAQSVPSLQGPCERLLCGVLGEVAIATERVHGAKHRAPLRLVEPLEIRLGSHASSPTQVTRGPSRRHSGRRFSKLTDLEAFRIGQW